VKQHTMSKQEKQAAYDAWFIKEVDKGIADCDAGNVVPHEQVMENAQRLLKKLKKQDAKKAA
jgi:predicted transcriptional regulator